MRRLLPAVLVALSVLVAPSGAMAASQDIWNTCHGFDADSRISACTKIIEGKEVRQDKAKAFYNRGNAFRYKGDNDRAIADFDQAITLDPKYVLAFSSRGDIYRLKGDYDLAIADYDRAIALDPNATDFTNRGMAYEVKGELEQARRDALKALQLERYSTEAKELLTRMDKKLLMRMDAAAYATLQPGIAETKPAEQAPAPAQQEAKVEQQTSIPAQQAAKAEHAPLSLGKRVALVIGNSAYQHTALLPNPRHDAMDTAEALRGLGFKVIYQEDATKQGMDKALLTFSREAEDAEAALFYYAGHAMQFEGVNYLMPVDAELRDEASLTFEMSRVDDALTGMRNVRGVRMAILDSCRNNPLENALKRSIARKTRNADTSRGLARITHPEGLLIAYSTQPGEVALDGNDNARNSPFTASFLRNVQTPGLEVGLLFRRITGDVRKATEGRQVPELSISLDGEFYFKPTAQAATQQ